MPLKCSNQGILGGAASVLFFFWFGRMPPEPNCGAVCLPFFFWFGRMPSEPNRHEYEPLEPIRPGHDVKLSKKKPGIGCVRVKECRAFPVAKAAAAVLSRRPP
jgi:hypothetical protein